MVCTHYVCACGRAGTSVCEAGREGEAWLVLKRVQTHYKKFARPSLLCLSCKPTPAGQQWQQHGPVLCAGVVAAMRRPHCEVLVWLRAAVQARCPVPAG